MGKTPANIRTIKKRIREYSASSLLENGPGIGSLTAEFIEWCDDVPKPAREDSAHLADTCLGLLAMVADTQDIQSVHLCLQALVRAGKFGRLLCARFIDGKNVSLRKLDAKIVKWPAMDRLALAHEMLLNYPGEHDKEILAWLESLLKPLVGADPRELAPFVAHLGKRGERLAFPAKQAITSGLFGRWVNTRIADTIQGAELTQLCDIIEALGDAHYAEALAKSIETGRIKANAKVLRTISAVGEANNRTILAVLVKVLSNSSNGLAGACLDAIIAQEHPKAGKLLASVRNRMPGLRQTAISRAPLLGDIGYSQYIRSLPEAERMDAHLEAFAALETIAPDFTQVATRSKQKPTTKKSLCEARPSQTEDPPTPPKDQTGLLKRLFKTKPKTLEALLPRFRNIREMELPRSHVLDEELEGRDLVKLLLDRSVFARTKFLRNRVAEVSLNNSTFSECAVTSTTFTQVSFAQADFSRTKFVRCTFEHCDLSEAVFSNCRFHECRFKRCSLGGATFQTTTMKRTDFTACSLAAVVLHQAFLHTTRFDTCDLSFSEIVCSDFRGVEFVACVLHAVYVRDCSLISVKMPGSTLTRSVVKNSDAAHPKFLANRIRQMTLFAKDAEAGGQPGSSGTDSFMAQKVLASWSRELTFMRRERRMLDNNRSRLARALSTMTPHQRTFVRLLPQLLDNDAFERRFDLEGVPSCRVWGHHPTLTGLELAKGYFGEPRPRSTSPEVRILAVYTMGSMGTVAQTAESDIDCWVCYDGDLTLNMENGLKHKLEALSLWAESEFGLEANFYPMRMDDARDNRFLSGDEESSGSAQVLLLKEEFYRTALKLAGKNLAWWVVPAGANRKHYENCISSARRYPLSGKPRLEDFGHLSPVPPDEYFGGSLWQMVKAVRAPFKSVLKLGLLETYAAPGATALPLCDRIKSSLVGNRRGKLDTDPYTALFSTLHSYYLGRKEANAAALLKESFRLKANLSDIPFFMNLPTRPEDESLISVLFGAGYVEPERIAGRDRSWPFEKSLKMGAGVRQYMVDTYQRIQSGLASKGKTKAFINAEDLTRMGRRIGANFAKKPHKIMRVPFMDAKGATFPMLHFSAEKAPGKPTIWAVRGGTAVEAKQSAGSLQQLTRSKDPIQMVAWLLANQLYHPKSLLQADRTIAPISVADLQKLMPALYDFFPFGATFEPDINEGLRDERVTGAYFLFNLTAPHDTNRIEQAAVVYATNWGEMFCRTFTKPGPMLEKNPAQFLAQKLDQSVSDQLRLGLFIPKGSQCKRISVG